MDKPTMPTEKAERIFRLLNLSSKVRESLRKKWGLQDSLPSKQGDLVIAEPRILTQKEETKLRRMNLPVYVERKVRDIWEHEKPSPELNTGVKFLFIWLLLPTLIALQVLNYAHNDGIVRLDSIAVVIVWILGILFALTAMVVLSRSLFKHEDSYYLKQDIMDSIEKTQIPLQSIYFKCEILATVIVTVYCGHFFAATVLFVSTLAAKFASFLLKCKVSLVVESMVD